MLFADAANEDRIVTGDTELTGGWQWMYSESPWAIGQHAIKYGINVANELIARSLYADTYVSNYESGIGPGDPTANITVFEMDFYATRIAVEPPPRGWIAGNFHALDLVWKALFGEERRPGADPLVLDLDGDGIELIAQTAISPSFDMDGDLFAELTGWVQPDDGFLVRDVNGNGTIDDISELFGSDEAGGFDMLATHDVNEDGVIDSQDPIFADLRVWRDLNQDGLSDAGELFTLTELGIASIGLGYQPLEDVLVANNRIDATGTFSRTDGSTGEIVDVTFRIDNHHTKFLGDTTVSAEAAELPNIKGFGILPDLQVAMTLDEDLLDLVEQTLPTLASLDLDDLREAITPILAAWAGPEAQGRRDVVTKISHNANGTKTVVDFALYDASTDSWRLASGDPILDDNEDEIEFPTLEDVLAQDPGADKAWQVLSGAQIGFFEAYLGEEFPIDQAVLTNSAAKTAVGSFLDMVVQSLDLMAVRLITQGGPLSAFFEGIAYNVEKDSFGPATDRQLIPVFEEIFTAAPNDQQGAADYLAAWKPILDVVMADYVRGESYLRNSFGFVFSNIVAAHEPEGLVLDVKAAAEALGIPENLIIVGSGEVTGTAEADIFYLNAGDQIVRGGAGADSYVVGRNFGNDVIDDIEVAGQDPHRPDNIRFADIASSEVFAERDGLDLVIRVIGTNDTLRVIGQFEGSKPGLFGGDLTDDRGITEIIFADGVVWDRIDIAFAVSHPLPTDDVLIGTPDIDVLDGGAGDDYLSGGDDTDIYLFGLGYGQDTIEDKQTNTLLPGNDYLIFGDGLTFNDLRFERDGNSDDLRVVIEGTGDAVTVIGQFDAFHTGPFDIQWFDRIESFIIDGTLFNYNDIMDILLETYSTDGDDHIYGFYREDVLRGGAGNDYLSGGDASDLYLFNIDDGQDIIEDNQNIILTASTDTLRFGPGIDPTDVILTRQGDSDDLVIEFTNSSDSVTIIDQFNASYTGLGKFWFDRIEHIEFMDGAETVWTWNQIMEMLVANAKTSGDDEIYGFDYEDILDGGAGDDLLVGGNENDIYIFGRGYGNDIIDEQRSNVMSGDFDIVQFNADVAPQDIVLERDDTSLIMRIHGTSDSLTILDQFTSRPLANSGQWIEEFHFSDGTIWTLDDVRLALLAASSTAGDDHIRGFHTADRLDGGAGNDYLDGWDGGDTYVFGTGYGHDTIYDSRTDSSNGGVDAVELTSELSPEDIIVSRVGDSDDVTLTISSTGETLTILNQNKVFSTGGAQNQIEEIRFAGGTVWTPEDLKALLLADAATSGDDEIWGFDGRSDVLDGGAGNDILHGMGGADTYIFGLGYGHDTIDEDNTTVSNHNSDRVLFGPGISVDMLSVSRSGNNMSISIDGTSDVLTILGQYASSGYQRIEYFEFAGGALLTAELIEALVSYPAAGSTTHGGTDGNETINGSSNNNSLFGRLGDDTLKGGAGDGNDVIDDSSLAADEVDTLWLGDLDASDIELSRLGNNLSIRILPTGETITVAGQFAGSLYGLEQIAFENGTIWNRSDIAASSWIRGTSGDDVLTGTSGADRIDPGAGADTVYAGGGDDVILASPGDDVFELGDGNDTVIVSPGNGTDWIIDFQAGADSDDVLDLSAFSAFTSLQDVIGAAYEAGGATWIDLGNGDEIGLNGVSIADLHEDDFLFAGQPGGNLIEGTAGDDVITGTSAADTIDAKAGGDVVYALAGDDVIYGSAGDDVFELGEGDDTFVFAPGDGTDWLIDFEAGSGSDDVIDLTAFSHIADLQDVLAAAYEVGNATWIDLGNGDEIGLNNVAIADLHTDDFRFAA